jgi:hypothetical protein
MSAIVRLRRGSFEPVRHEAMGVATAIRPAGGGLVLTLTGFAVDNVPISGSIGAGRSRSCSHVRLLECEGWTRWSSAK